MDAQDLAGIDLEKLEEALNQKDLQGLPEEQLERYTRSSSTQQQDPQHA
jgi:hypothetical protein